MDVYVCADNCTDGTAAVARARGAIVFERFDSMRIGKGYALDFLFERLRASGVFARYDGFFFFDADNLLHEDFIAEMNKSFAAGNRIVTSYRNSDVYKRQAFGRPMSATRAPSRSTRPESPAPMSAASSASAAASTPGRAEVTSSSSSSG